MSDLCSLVGDKLQTKDGVIDTSSLKFGDGEYIALYFSAHWCPPCRSFTPKLKEFYEKLNSNAPRLKIAFVSSDRTEEEFNEYYESMPWMAVPYSDRDAKKKLSAKFKVSGIPTLVLLDSNGNTFATEGDGRTLVMNDPTGAKFPWPRKPIAEVLAGELIDKNGAAGTLEELMQGGAHIGLYFSAHWCPPCKMFTPQLAETYQKVKDKGHNFEIVFVSSDKSEKEFDEYLATMPWKAVPMDDPRVDSLNSRFDISGIPSLVILGPDGSTITEEGRQEASSDKEGEDFPWHPKPVNPLSAVASKLNDLPILVLFLGGNDQEVKQKGQEMLLPVAERLGKAAMPIDEAELLLAYVGEDDPLAKRLRGFAQLPSADERPSLLAIIRIPSEDKYIHSGEINSASDVQTVVDDFKAEKLEFKELRE